VISWLPDLFARAVLDPESAVSHPRPWMIEAARSAGFAEADVILPNYQSTIACRKGA
jgi:hypothetical protein